MILRRFNILLLILFLSKTLFSQNNITLDFKGSDRISAIELEKATPELKNILFNLSEKDSLSKKISHLFESIGYIGAGVISISDSLAPDSIVIRTVQLTEGLAAFFEKIIIHDVLEEDSLQFERAFDFLIGTPYSPHDFEAASNRIIESLENEGFPFAKVKILSVRFKQDETEEKFLAEINLAIDRSNLSRIDVIEVKGNSKTKDYVIARNLRIDKGELYSQELIDKVPARLNRLKYFEPVQAPSYYINSKGEGVLSISVKEKVTNSFDGIVGYIPPAAKEAKGYFTGYISISLRNIIGTERNAAFRWQQENRYSQELEIKYLEPWLFDFPVNISGGLVQRKQDTTYIQRKYELFIDYLATNELSGGISFSSESTIPFESQYAGFSVYNSTMNSTGLSFKYDGTDDFYAPTEGIVLRNNYKYSLKRIFGPEKYLTSNIQRKLNYQRLEFDLEMYYQIFIRQIAAFRIFARELRGSAFEISDLYYLGGTRSLRGYRERQFSGNRIIWNNLEYRYLLSRRSYGFIFMDMGYYLRNEEKERNISGSSGFKTGYGFGLNLETGLGVLTVSYALGKGDSFSDGKIHFGIINEF